MSVEGTWPRPPDARSMARLLAVPVGALALSLVVLSGLTALGDRRLARLLGSRDEVLYGEPLDPAQPIEIVELLRRWNQLLGVCFVCDPTIKGTKVRILDREACLTWHVFKKILNFRDVDIEEEDYPGRRTIVFVRRRRMCSSRLPPPIHGYERAAPKETPEPDVLAAIVPVDGSGRDAFARVRRALNLDPNRTGNALYVKGRPELIVVVDEAVRVEWYLKLLGA